MRNTRFNTLGLFLLLALLLAACGKDTGPTDTLNAATEHLRAGDFTAMAALTTDPGTIGDVGELEGLFEGITHHLSVEVLEQKIDGNEATVRARVKNVSLDRVMADFMTFGNMLMYGLMGEDGEEMMMAALVSEMRRDDAPTRTEEVDVRLRKVSGKWLLHVPSDFDDVPPAFWNAAFGYMGDFAF